MLNVGERLHPVRAVASSAAGRDNNSRTRFTVLHRSIRMNSESWTWAPVLGLNEIAGAESEVGDLKKQLRPRRDVFGAGLRQDFLCRDDIEEIADAIAVSFMRRFVRLLGSSQQGSGRLLLPQRCLHFGVSGPHLVRNLVAKRVDLGLRNLFVGRSPGDIVFASRAVEEGPFEL